MNAGMRRYGEQMLLPLSQRGREASGTAGLNTHKKIGNFFLSETWAQFCCKMWGGAA